MVCPRCKSLDVGSNPQYWSNWDNIFGGRKAQKAASDSDTGKSTKKTSSTGDSSGDDNKSSSLVANNTTTDDTVLDVSGTLGGANAGANLGTGDTLRIYDGTAYLGNASVND